MTVKGKAIRTPRVPGRQPGPEHFDEVARVWGAVDDDGRKVILFVSRQLAREQGIVPADTPLIITNRVL